MFFYLSINFLILFLYNTCLFIYTFTKIYAYYGIKDTLVRALEMATLNISIITNLYLNKTYIENIVVLNNVCAI